MNIYANQDRNIRLTWVLMGLFLVFTVAVGWMASYVFQNQIILVVAVLFAIVMNIASFWYSDKIVLSLYKAKEVTHTEYPDLWNILENLAITAGLPKPRLFIVPDSQPNAFATGRDPEHAVIAVTSGLLEHLDRTELEGVVAHEMSHIGNRDILLQTVVVVLVGFLTLLSDMFLRASLYGNNRSRDNNNNAGAVLMVIGIVLIILSPFIAMIIQLAISRKREFLADASGALLTRYPEGLASALEKISGYAGEMKHASNATAHLFISNPFGSKSKRYLAGLFNTHPSIEERIARLRGIRDN